MIGSGLRCSHLPTMLYIHCTTHLCSTTHQLYYTCTVLYIHVILHMYCASIHCTTHSLNYTCKTEPLYISNLLHVHWSTHPLCYTSVGSSSSQEVESTKSGIPFHHSTHTHALWAIHLSTQYTQPFPFCVTSVNSQFHQLVSLIIPFSVPLVSCS